MALTLVEDLSAAAEGVLVLSLVVAIVWAGWRGIKIIVIHRRNGEDE